MPDTPDKRPPSDVDEPTDPQRPGGLIGLLVGGIEALFALMGQLVGGLIMAILGNLTGASRGDPATGDVPPEPGDQDQDAPGDDPPTAS